MNERIDISEIEKRKAAVDISNSLADRHLFIRGIDWAIAYANDQLSKDGDTTPPNPPFLSDEDIGSGSLDFYNNNAPTPTAGQIAAWKIGAKWARDRYEGREGSNDTPVAPWTPEVGMKCAFWDDGFDIETEVGLFGVFTMQYDGQYRLSNITYWDHCALIESLDEIGKPPQYFIDRGRWSGEK